MDNILIPLYHVPGCGKIAMYSTKRLVRGVDELSSETIRNIDGSIPIDCVDDIVCGSCGAFMPEMIYEAPDHG